MDHHLSTLHDTLATVSHLVRSPCVDWSRATVPEQQQNLSSVASLVAEEASQLASGLSALTCATHMDGELDGVDGRRSPLESPSPCVAEVPPTAVASRSGRPGGLSPPSGYSSSGKQTEGASSSGFQVRLLLKFG